MLVKEVLWNVNATKNCLVFVVTKSESFFVPMSLCSISMRLHGSSLHSSDNAATITSILSSKKAKPIMVSLRYQRWRRKLFRAALAIASLVALYWASCCNNSKSCGGAESADGQQHHAFK